MASSVRAETLERWSRACSEPCKLLKRLVVVQRPAPSALVRGAAENPEPA